MSHPLLSISGLTAGYGANEVLHTVSVSMLPGEILGVIGPNGAGKTTLMRALFGLLALKAGRIELEGQDISALPVRDRIRRGIAYVPQERNVFPNLTVAENLKIARNVRAGAEDARGNPMDLVFSLFPRLHERRQQLAGTMSGGEQRMVAIGIGLMAGPRLLILDEPTTGLAPSVVHQLMTAIQTLNEQHGISAIVVEQNILSLLKVASAVDIMKAGRVTRHKGKPEELMRRDLWEFL